MCSLQRPLDTKDQIRIAVEAEAILNVIALWEAGQLEIVSSPALVFEAEQIKLAARKAYTLNILSKANIFSQATRQIETKTQVFIDLGIKPLDALHLALSVESKADYFCTCDDRFLRRAKEANTLTTRVVSPLELIVELTK